MIYFGADYYPEHWDEDRWKTDIQLMAQAGFNVVRLAEFAWSVLEPEDNVFDFDWLDRIIDLLGQKGIKVVLGTPSAAMPPWIQQAIPDVMLVDANGVSRGYGSRRDYSPTNDVYIGYAVRIARKMAEHYANNPNIIGWQIDNELGDRCYAPSTKRQFQQWLQEKYGTLDALNQCWGTRFWSHVYQEWSQIPVPLMTATGPHNPGLHLDFYRFISDVYVDFQQKQIDVIRSIVPEYHFITHNLMGFAYPNINYFDFSKDLDFISWDNYPRGFWITDDEIDPTVPAISHTLMRSLKKKNFWVMEQQSGHGSWTIMPPIPRPGEIELWAYQAIAHGASGIVFFRWRTARFGAEQFWHGILDHDGVGRRRYAEVVNVGKTIKRIQPYLEDAQTNAQVAILFSYDSSFAFEIQPNNPDLSYRNHVHSYYRALHKVGIDVDFVAPDEDFSNYKLVIVPALYVTTPETVQHLTSFVERGGIVIVTTRSGVKNIDNAVVDSPLPGLLQDLCGVQVDEYDSPLTGQNYAVEFTEEVSSSLISDGGAEAASIWCDVLQTLSAKPIAYYTENYYAGTPVITLNSVGQGKVIYVGTIGNQALVQSLVSYGLQLANLKSVLCVPSGVEVTSRWQGDQQILFVLNHNLNPECIELDSEYLDLVTCQNYVDQVDINPKQVLVLKRVGT
ncbi:MAG: beta-galactosidase [Aggregatilineales bacterium]